jgi:hypothetical protein
VPVDELPPVEIPDDDEFDRPAPPALEQRRPAEA